jgi:prepilin-type N-terminal cleavage/methylation domain-containing protein
MMTPEILIRRNNGWTLVEVLVSTAVAGVVSAVIYLMFVANFFNYERQALQSTFWQEADHIMETITYQARSASLLRVEQGAAQSDLICLDATGTQVCHFQMFSAALACVSAAS